MLCCSANFALPLLATESVVVGGGEVFICKLRFSCLLLGLCYLYASRCWVAMLRKQFPAASAIGQEAGLQGTPKPACS